MNQQRRDFLDDSLREFLERVASKEPAPGGGAVAAIVVALAAGLVGMAARFSGERWEDAEAVAARADALRLRVAPLAQADAEAYTEVLRAFRLPKDADPDKRKGAISDALGRATEVPLAIARDASALAALTTDVAEHGNPNLRGDAVAAAVLAAAGAKAAANLVVINLEGNEDDERMRKARAYATEASAAAEKTVSLQR